MKNLNILITGVGSITSNSIIKSYREVTERNIRIIGVDIKKYPLTNSLDNFYQIVRPNDKNYIDILIDICKKENIDFLIPLVDCELVVLSQNKELFKSINTIVCVNEVEKIKLIQNKYYLYNFLNKNNISTPKCQLFNDIESFVNACKLLNYPSNTVCYKPVVSSGSRGFKIIDNSLDLKKFLFNEKPNSKYINYDFVKNSISQCNNIPDMVLMEYISGDYFNVDVVCKDGIVIDMVICKVLNFELGNTVECETVVNEEVRTYCKNIIKILNLTGNIGIELAYDKHNILKIIEINPRIQGEIYFSVKSGINLPYLCLKMYLNEEVTKISNNKNIKMMRYFDEVIYENK